MILLVLSPRSQEWEAAPENPPWRNSYTHNKQEENGKAYDMKHTTTL
jgi:hypothetical protein